MHRDAQLDPSQSTIWLLCTKRDGVFSKAVCLDTLERFDFRLCELNMQENPNSAPPIAVYYRHNRSGEIPRRPQSPILLFCVFLNPRERKLEFLGSILADGESKLYAICFGNICGLRRELEDAECSFFRVDSEEDVIQISSFQKTVKAVRFITASVVRKCV